MLCLFHLVVADVSSSEIQCRAGKDWPSGR